MSQFIKILNVVSYSSDWRARILSNFAHTPFEIDSVRVESVEGFWQGLKFNEGSREQQVAFAQWGLAAKRLGRHALRRGHFTWQGQRITVSGPEHLALLHRALWAKFTQVPKARAALLATKGLGLVHKVGHDSKVIPGQVFATMLMQIREELRTSSAIL